jgi:tripartite ATP-independent transporter DctP family solute receptor
MRQHLAAIALAASASALLGAARADEGEAKEFIVKFGSAAPDDTPWARQMQRFKSRFEKESSGRVKLKLFLGSSKGGEDAMVRQCAQGTLQAVGVTTGALAILVPELDVLELPYRFASQEEVDRVLDDPEVWAAVKKLLEKKGLEPYIFSENGWRNFASKSRPIRSPADLKGVKMRSQENRVHIEMYKAIGASPVPFSIPETIGALQTGVVDGFDNSPLFAEAANWYQGIKYWTVSDHIYQPAMIVYNKAWYDALPKDVRELLVSQREEETRYGRGLIRKLNEPLIQNLRDAGIEVYRLTPEERKKFADAVAPVYAKIRAQLSPQGQALYDLIARKLGRK